MSSCFFFFNDTATTEIYTLSLHDALPICGTHGAEQMVEGMLVERGLALAHVRRKIDQPVDGRSEEHTSELQSPCNLVCRLLLEKKNEYRTQLLHIRPVKKPLAERPGAIRA